MPSNNVKEHALKAIKENPEVFEALAEYDKTRKLPKTAYRERINVTIDANLLRKFRKYAKERGLNMSRIVEKHIKEEMGIKNK